MLNNRFFFTTNFCGYGNGDLSVGPPLGPNWNIPTTIWWITMTFSSNRDCAQRMFPNDSGCPLASPPAPPRGWHLWFWAKYLKMYFGWLPWNLYAKFAQRSVQSCICPMVLFKNKFLPTNNIPSRVLSLFSKISKVLSAVFLSSEGLFMPFEVSK